jgi:hypothetical protein
MPLLKERKKADDEGLARRKGGQEIKALDSLSAHSSAGPKRSVESTAQSTKAPLSLSNRFTREQKQGGPRSPSRDPLATGRRGATEKTTSPSRGGDAIWPGHEHAPAEAHGVWGTDARGRTRRGPSSAPCPLWAGGLGRGLGPPGAGSTGLAWALAAATHIGPPLRFTPSIIVPAAHPYDMPTADSTATLPHGLSPQALSTVAARRCWACSSSPRGDAQPAPRLATPTPTPTTPSNHRARAPPIART